MALTVGNTKDFLTRRLHGTNINDVTDVNGLLFDAARKVLAEVDPAETRRVTNLSNAIHDDVFNYTLPNDLKGRKVIDIRPQANRTVGDNFSQRLSEAFDLQKNIEDNTFSIRHSDGTKSIRISKNISPAPVTLNEFDSLTANGTVAIVGTAAGLAVNNQFFISGSGSVEFDSAASADGVQVTAMTSVDLTKHDEVSTMFLRFYADDVSNITSATLIWGNDLSTAFWTGVAQTAQFDGTAFRNGWNTISVPWSTATETGTVDPAAIDSLKVTFATSGTVDNLRVDFWTSSIGEIFEIEYYSKFLFRNSGGTWIESPTADSDIINLDTESYNLFLYEAAILAAQQVAGEDMASDVGLWTNELYGGGGKLGLYRKYKKDNINESILPQGRYYNLPSKGDERRNS